MQAISRLKDRIVACRLGSVEHESFNDMWNDYLRKQFDRTLDHRLSEIDGDLLFLKSLLNITEYMMSDGDGLCYNEELMCKYGQEFRALT